MTSKYHFSLILLTLLSSSCWAVEQISDPTMPAHYNANSASSSSTQTTVPVNYEWVLNSTLISPHLQVAIINGKQIKIGDEINGAILEQIDHQQVSLRYQQQMITLLLHQSFISKIKAPSGS